MQKMRKTGFSTPMPPNPAPLIVRWLTEIGLQQAGAMTAAPISWAEITAWQRATSTRLEPWEARLIRRLSVDFVAESRRAEEETCPPPWRAPVTESDREAEERALERLLG